MNGDIEQLLREGLDRLTAELPAPAGVAGRARARLRRRRVAVRAALAGVTAAVLAVGALVVAGLGRQASVSTTAARTTAYVVSRVENALATENFVIEGQASGTLTVSVHGHRVRSSEGLTGTWAYGNKNRMEELTPGGRPYLAEGTALVGGKLVSAYVTYYDHRYSIAPLGHFHLKACSPTAQLVLGGAAVTVPNWPAFLKAMLGCGTATVTGHARIGGVATTVISGSVDVPLSRGYARTVKETRVRVRYTLYVDSATYLPVRIYGSTETYGGPADPTVSAYVTNVHWLPPTAANIAKALVTVPPGYQLWTGSQASQ
jgi:hypothetical protein